jgi:hypothetical protein
MSSTPLFKTHGTSNNLLIVPVIEKVYDCPDARKVVLSEDYLFLQNGDNEIIFFEHNQNKTIFRSNSRIYGFTAINHTLIIPNHTILYDSILYAVCFENYSHPSIISNISHSTTGSITPISSYNHFVFTANYEHGFPIFNYSNRSHPKHVGQMSSYNWHSQQTFCVSQYGFFSGDFQTAIYDLRNSNPIKAKRLKKFDYEPFNSIP